MDRKLLGLVAVAGLGLTVAFGAAAAANGDEPVATAAKKAKKVKKVKVKTGIYTQTVKRKITIGGQKVEVAERGAISTVKGKISDVIWGLLFRGPDGNPCEVTALPPLEWPNITYNYYFQPKKPVAPNRKNRFSFKSKPGSPIAGSIRGRFLTPKKATFTIKAAEGNCKAKMTFKKAKFTTGD